MRALCTLAAVMALMCSVATAKINQKWVADAELGQFDSTASNDKQVFTGSATDNKIRAFDSSTGANQWTIAGVDQKGYAIGSLGANDKGILAVYAPTAQNGDPELLYVYDGATGSKIWNATLVGAQWAGISKKDFIQVVSNMNGGFNIIAKSLESGSISYNTTITESFEFITGGGVGDNIISLLAQGNGFNTYSYNFDINTGKFLCKFENSYISFQPNAPTLLIAGDSILAQGTFNFYLYDGLTCAKKHEFSTMSFNAPTLAVVGNDFYHIDKTGKVQRFTKDGVKSWEVTTNAGSKGNYAAVSATAFNPDAVIVNNKGVFSAVNKTSGVVQWNSTTYVPYGQPNNRGVQLYPLGNGVHFLPNLQGHVVIDSSKGIVESTDEFNPIVGTFAFKDAAGHPYVVYGDVKSGFLQAITYSK